MLQTRTHPTDTALNDFLLGKLPDPDDAEVESHLGECPECQSRAAASHVDDTFVELLASVGTRADADHFAAPTPTLAGGVTPSLFAATRAWDGTTLNTLDAEVPAALAGCPKYRVVRRLGVGGMGTVWLAEHTVMNRPVAVKVIRPELLAKSGATGRFLREVRAAAKLHHPNIVTAFDAEPVGDSCLLVMEYVPGETLADCVKPGPLPVADACRAIRDAARGLVHAHKAGLVHRDVKPHNLIRAVDGTVKVLDFGLAGVGADEGIAAAGDGLTGAGMVCGTPEYIAPEQIANPHTADARADIYGLGCSFYHLLAGRPPFPGGSIAEKLAAQEKRTPDPIPELARDLAAVLAKMLAKQADDRYQTADEVAAALEVVIQSSPLSERAEKTSARGLLSRRWVAIAAGLLCATVAVAAGVIFKVQRDNEEITIETNDPDIEIVMKRKGELVRIRDPKSGQTWELNTLTNQIGLADQADGLKLDLPGKEPFVLRRKGEKVFTITRVPTAIEEKVGEVRCFKGHTGGVFTVAISPDGRRALSGSGAELTDDPAVRLWDLETGKELHRLEGHTAGVRSVVFSPDGKQALTASYDKTIRLWDIETGKELRRFEGHTGWVMRAIFSPNGKMVLSGCTDNTARLWDAATGKELKRFPHTSGVQGVAFSPDGRRILSGCEGGIMCLWDAAKAEELRRFVGHTDLVTFVAFSPDGRQALSGSRDRTVRLWDVETGKELHCCRGHTKGVDGVAFSPDGRRAVSAGYDQTIRLWDVATGKELACLFGHNDAVFSVVISPNGRYALSGSWDKTMRLWRLPDPWPNEKVGQVAVFENHKDYVQGIAVSRDGRYAVSGGGGKILGGQLVPGAKDYDIRIWDLEKRTEVRRLTGSNAPVYWLALSPDGRRVLSGSGFGEGAIRLWDTETGKELKRVDRGESAGAIWSLAFSPDGRQVLAATSGGKDVYLLDAETLKEVKRFEGHTESVRQAIFSSDGRLALSAGYDGTARLWDIETGKQLQKFEGHTGDVNSVAFSPDGSRVLTGGSDHTVRLWDAETGKQLKLFEGHKAAVGSVAFSPDGRFALSGGGSTGVGDEEDFSLRLWDLESGKELHRFEGHRNFVSQVIWLPDGCHALSGSWDTTIRLWRLPELPPVSKP